MKKHLFRFGTCILLIVFFVSCGASKKVRNQQTAVVEEAKTYLGAPYAFGGTSKRGIDCSGLVINSFSKENISLPRTTSDLIKEGKKVGIKKLRKGDLVFFSTSKPKRKVNHVGIVTETHPEVKFIHSSTSRGVMLSSLNEAYWRKNFRKARRILR